MTIVNNLLSLALIALVLAMLFRYVPDVEISWQDTLVGAFVTACLLTVGKYALGVYLGRAAVGSAYGAAASAVVFMVWVYYTSVILFLGAKSTKVIARHHGSPIRPSAYAKPIGGEDAYPAAADQEDLPESEQPVMASRSESPQSNRAAMH